MNNMKKLMTYIAAGLMALCMNSCLDLDPTSEYTDENFWKTEDQFDAFHTGLKGQFRNYAYDFVVWGEFRSDIYAGQSFSGESNTYQRIFNNNLDASNSGVSDFGGVYTCINQLNLMIDKANESTVISEAAKNKYLGAAYGMRAFMYFQLLRSYGDVVIYTQHTEGATLDLNNLSKEQSPAADVLALIKDDIQKSEEAYNDNYSFTDTDRDTEGRTSWSLAATKMLKGEVYLWSGKQMGGGEADYRTAKQAYLDVDHADVDLLDDYASVFSFNNKENKEIIFAIYNGEKEKTLWNGSYSSNLVLKAAKMGAYLFSDPSNPDFFVSISSTDYAKHDGNNFLPINKDMFYDDGENGVWRVWRNGDQRARATLRDVWNSNGSYAGLLANKYHGTVLTGGNKTSWYDDQPIYRYADCLLGLAEAEVLLGEDPSEEINWIRERAYGKAYFDAHPEVQYPNDTDTEYYDGNKFVGSDADPEEAVLKERMRELMFEGKRWYDIRLMDKATKYSSATKDRLLWPIDENALGENSKLKQTPGYTKNTAKK